MTVVRDYVLYDRRIRDRRTGEVVTDVDKFLDGRIDDTMRGVLRYRASVLRNNGA